MRLKKGSAVFILRLVCTAEASFKVPPPPRSLSFLSFPPQRIPLFLRVLNFICLFPSHLLLCGSMDRSAYILNIELEQIDIVQKLSDHTK